MANDELKEKTDDLNAGIIYKWLVKDNVAKLKKESDETVKKK